MKTYKIGDRFNHIRGDRRVNTFVIIGEDYHRYNIKWCHNGNMGSVSKINLYKWVSNDIVELIKKIDNFPLFELL